MSNKESNMKSGFTMAMFAAMASGRDPMDSTPDAIVASEKAGQQRLVNGAMLPVDMRNTTIAKLEGLGFVFGKAGRLFIEATMPEGWKKEATDHDMWSLILDDQGNERASVFYKAAWYDESAILYWKGGENNE